MASRRVREVLRLRRMEFDKTVEENRRQRELDEMLDRMTRAQLIDYASDNGIKIDKTAKKAEMLDAIKESLK